MVSSHLQPGQRATVTSPALISPTVLVGKSRRQEVREALAAEGMALLQQERSQVRMARQARKVMVRQARAELVAYAAFSQHENGWHENEAGGVLLAVDGDGNFLAPSWKDHTWYVPFSLTKPLHLVAWMRSARTGKIVSVET